jgi:hypothetical protein
VVILWGRHEGREATLHSIDTGRFAATVKLDTGEKVRLPYEQFSKEYSDEIVEVKVEPKKEVKKEYDLNQHVITIE